MTWPRYLKLSTNKRLLLDSPTFHLFSNPYIGAKLINAFTTQFSRSPTKHSNLPGLHSAQYPIKHLHSFFYHCLSQTPLSFLSTQNNRQIIYSSRTCSIWNALPNEFCQPAIHSSHANQFGCTALLLDLYISISLQA